MVEKKNLIIKVKYPTGAKANPDAQPAAQVITIWNIPRIAMAVGILLGLIILLVYLLGGHGEKPVTIVANGQVDNYTRGEPSANMATQPSPVVGEGSQADAITLANAKAAKPALDGKLQTVPTLPQEMPRVRRAMLASHINDKEPVTEISQTVQVQPSKLATIYYFNELRGMNGKILYHEWLHNGALVSKEPLQVGADRWRVSSHKTFDTEAVGNWLVKLTDGNGAILNEKSFTVSVGP